MKKTQLLGSETKKRKKTFKAVALGLKINSAC